MAFLGGLGKALGFGTTQQIVQDITGSRVAGAVAGQAAKGLSSLTRQSRTEQGQATAVAVPQAPPAETAFSGETVSVRQPVMQPSPISYSPGIQPAIMRTPMPPQRAQVTPAGLPAIVGGGLTAGRGVMNMLGIAGGAITVAPFIIDPFTGEEKKLRVTRRLKSQVKKAVEMFGIEFVAEQMGVDVEVVVYIMTKRMRNDGPYVTKAAVRKTRATVRKMKNLCDMYDDLRPAARRRAPARKTMSTRITNVK